MSLSHHINADKVLAHSKEQAHKTGRKSAHQLLEREAGSVDTYGTKALPKYNIPSKGIPGEEAYEFIHNELSLDGNPLLNLASFVHTHMVSPPTLRPHLVTPRSPSASLAAGPRCGQADGRERQQELD